MVLKPICAISPEQFIKPFKTSKINITSGSYHLIQANSIDCIVNMI